MEIQLLINHNGLCYSTEDLSRLPNSEEIKTAEAWIKLYAYPMKGVNHNISSYGLKHRAEEFGRLMNEHFNTGILSSYVSNGAFIQAALNLEYEPFPTHFKSPNAFFRMGLKIPRLF